MSENENRTILVVDDNEANRLLAESTLEDEGYRVFLAKGGAEGVSLFETAKPDCVLLDVRMPEVDGFSACRQIRALPNGADVPILFLTALRDVDTFDQAVRAGGTDFLTKPVSPSELIVRVETALKLRRMSDELREQFDALKHQRDDLLRLQLQKERLMAFVVHDLKNPVNSMDLHAQLLAREQGLSEAGARSIAQIRVEARQLNRMILNLLDLSKADEGQLSPKRSRFDVVPVVKEVMGELAVNAGARDVSLEAGRPLAANCLVDGDVDLIRRMLANLVENAIRYAPKGTSVTVSFASDSEATELRVSDRGVGVPLDQRARIFDPFVQIESKDGPTSRGGRGLGLTFCRLVAEAHGGRIWIEDGSPGSVFCVRLPHDAQ